MLLPDAESEAQRGLAQGHTATEWQKLMFKAGGLISEALFSLY